MSKFISVILADLAMVGFAISFLTLARVELPIAFSWFLCDMPQDDIEMESMVSHFAQSETCRLERGKGAAEDCSVVNTRATLGGVGSRIEQ